jgi:transposase
VAQRSYCHPEMQRLAAVVNDEPKALERRRLMAAELLESGLSQAEVARQLGVSRQSANRWYQDLYGRHGRPALSKKGITRRSEVARLWESGLSREGVAEALGLSGDTVRRWGTYADGRDMLRAKPRGLYSLQMKELPKLLGLMFLQRSGVVDGQQWTCAEIAEKLSAKHPRALTFDRNQVWRALRKLGWTYQRRTGQTRKNGAWVLSKARPPKS